MGGGDGGAASESVAYQLRFRRAAALATALCEKKGSGNMRCLRDFGGGSHSTFFDPIDICPECVLRGCESTNGGHLFRAGGE